MDIEKSVPTFTSAAEKSAILSIVTLRKHSVGQSAEGSPFTLHSFTRPRWAHDRNVVLRWDLWKRATVHVFLVSLQFCKHAHEVLLFETVCARVCACMCECNEWTHAQAACLNEVFWMKIITRLKCTANHASAAVRKSKLFFFYVHACVAEHTAVTGLSWTCLKRSLCADDETRETPTLHIWGKLELFKMQGVGES